MKAQTALDALNEKLGEKINVTLEAAAISPWGDWTQKIPIVLASGGEFRHDLYGGLGVLF